METGKQVSISCLISQSTQTSAWN